MYARHLALLARQPSATLKPRDTFWGMPKRGLAFILANAMFWQPLWAQAEGIVVSAPGTSLGQAGNGVPIVNIATPNGSGLSHNQFHDYNVGQQGLILNNATDRTQSTQLGGIILGNPNLKGAAAQTILNEVNGGSPSQLRGYTEVAGQSARVIVANPYGISCNGCGFINTPRATLTTGKPIIENGQLSRYQVDQGQVVIEGTGIDASNIGSFEIITRSAQINAQINAKHLAVIAGANDVDAGTLKATARAANPADAPQLAIDSSALGGMYAGAIKLVGTEAGVGVKLAGNLAASGGDIQIDANGRLSMAKAAATGAIDVKAASVDVQGPAYAGTSLDINSRGDLNSQKTLAARDRISLSSGGRLTNHDIVEAGVNADNSRNGGGDLNITTQILNNSGTSLIASRNLTVNAAQTLNNQGGTLSAKQAATISTGTLDNQNQGRVLSTGSLNLNANQLLNTQGGLVTSSSPLSATIGQLNNRSGEFSSLGAMALNVASLDNVAGLVSAGKGLSLTASGTINNQNGQLTSQEALNLKAGALDNSAAGRVASNQAMTVQVDQALVNAKGVIAAGTLDLRSMTLDNREGLLSSRGEAKVTVAGAFQNQAGILIGDGNTQLSAARLDNSGGQISSKKDLTAHLADSNNQNGSLVAEGSLKLDGTSLDNRQNGLVGATQGVELKVGSVDNRGGEVSSKGAVSLSGRQLDNSDGGRVTAGTTLALTVDQLLNRNQGQLSAQSGLSLQGQRLDNTGGSLLSQQGVDIKLSGDADNRQGLISSEGVLSVQAANLDNRLGSLSSAGPLTVTTQQALNNQGGRLATDGTLAVRSASLDNRQKGTLSSLAALKITTGAFDNSHAGTVSTRDTLAISAGQLTNQDAGSITSSKALTAKVSGLDQQGGKLFSETSVDLDLNHGQLNNQGGLINAPLLMLNNLNGVNNQGGEISSAQAFTLAATSLDNSNGKLLSNQALTLRIEQALNNLKGLIAAQSVDGRAASLDNSGGTLTSRSDLLLNVAGQLNNQNDGLINATNALTLNSAGLNNQQGSLLGSAIAIDLGQATGDLNNNAGLITTAGPLTIKHLRDLSNQGGEISSTRGLDLTGRTLDNSRGKLISNQLLTLNANSLINQGGLMSGWQGLSVKGSDLDNRTSGTLSSRDGDLDIKLSNQLLNSGSGALVSKKLLTVKAAGLDNSAQGIVSSGGGQTLIVSGLLNNAQGGLIDSGAALGLQARTLNNSGGTIQAQQPIDVAVSTLDNSGGSLIGNGAVTLDLLGALTNANGKLASGGALLVKRSSRIDNQGGQLASQGLLTLLTGTLDNRNRGTVAASQTLSLTATDAVQNSGDGLIYSQNADLSLKAASLDNAKGAIQSQTGLALDVAGDIDNQSGKVIAQTGDVSLKANTIDNRGGILASIQGALEARTVGVLRNGYDLNNNRQGGIVQAQRLNLTTGRIDNNGGRISAQTGDAVVTTGDFDNRDGGLYGKGAVKVTGNNFDNRGEVRGQVAAGLIDLNLSGALNNQQGIIESDSTLKVHAASVDNQKGQLRALGSAGTTRFQIGGLFDNRNGTLETANQDLLFQAGSLLNTGGTVLHVGSGTFGIAMANLNNASGSLITRGSLTVDQDSWSNSSVIQAGRLTVKVNSLTQTADGQLLASDSFTGSGVNWTTAGLIASDGSFDLTLAGNLNSSGRASSKGAMNLTLGQLGLSSSASLAGGGDTTVKVTGLLDNSGRLTSAADLNLSAAGINNYGTLGSAQQLTLTTGALLNDHALIFSGGDMSLRLDSLNNSYADLYSLGNLSIDRDGQGGLASSILNRSANIQSDGNLSLAASTIQNIRAILTTNNLGIYTARIGEIACIEGVNAGDCSGKRNHVWELVQRDKFEVTEASAASSITSGGNLNIKGGDLLNQSSTIATAGNLVATVNNLTNSGIETGETETTRVFRSERTRNAGGWYDAARAVTDKYWFESPGYTPNDVGGLQAAISRFIGMTEFEMPEFGKTQKIAGSDQSYTAVIQAGGAVNIQAQNNIDNSVVRPGYTYIGSGAKTDTAASGASGSSSNYSTRISLNSQLPPDLAQQQVNPLSLPGFSLPTGQNGLFRLSGEASSTAINSGPQSWALGAAAISAAQRQQGLPGNQGQDIQSGNTAAAVVGPITVAGGQRIDRVQGLPSSAGRSNPNKYLIETNPALTNLKQFMSSDYLLSNLGYNPDESWKRLGDGLYEQRLIQQAVVARTGQRFLDGQTSDEALFKYLMDNALKSKQQLNLAVGVSLTAEQVAALTHDIVWMETAEVNGEQVLVPVLYLAQSNNRLAPNGALIAGNDLNLIAGQDLHNVGTLRATANLSAQVGQNLVNSGLVEAGNRLELLAGNNLTNQAGGIIAGRDVSLTTVNGDLLNERTVTAHASSSGYRSERTAFIDSAARIEAANNLSLTAGRDVNNLGGVLKSGADTRIQAGRDVNITSAEQVVSGERGAQRNQTITQHGSSLEAGRDLTIRAGRDISAVASQIDAKRDIAIAATQNLTLASAADEQHSYNKTKKVTSQEDHVSQVATSVTAGGDVTLSAGKDMALIASKVTAGDEAYLVAGEKLELLAAQDSDYSLYDMKKKGSWGSKKTQRDEVTDVKNIGSEIKTGGDLTLQSGGDQKYQAAKLESGKDLALISGGEITFEAVKDLHQESHEKSSNSLVWTSAKGKGTTDETLRQTEIVAQGKLAIQAVDGLNIDIKQIDQKSVSQTIDAMVQADPQLAWLKEAEQRGDVDWRKVQEVHDSFKYSHSGLGGGAALVIAIIVTYFTWGAGASLVGAASTTTTGIAANSVVSAVAVKGATSTINNKGNLGDIAKDVTSGESLKGYAIAGISGAVSQLAGVSGGFTASDLGRQIAVNSALKTATNGGSFIKNVGQAAIDLTASLVSGAIYEQVGTHLSGTGLSTKVAVHAIVGGLIAEAAGGDFTSGAIAAGANKALIQSFGAEMFPGEAHDRVLAMTSQLIGMTVAAGVGGSSKDQEVAGWVAQQGTVYNYLEHSDVKAFAKDMQDCGTNTSCQESRWKNEKYNEESLYNTQYAMQISSSLLAKDKLPGVIAGLDELMAIPCQTQVCESYKAELVSRSVAAAEHLAKQIADWGPSMDRLALLGGGGAANSRWEAKPKLPGATEPAGLIQLEKAIKYLQAAKGTGGALGKPLVSKGSEVTPEIIQKALQGDPAISGQKFVSLPAVQRYVDRLLKGDVAPPIKMDGNIIVDGNHRYIAAKILGRKPEVAPGTLPPSKAGQTRPVLDVKIDPVDWGNR
ncbi:filamentous hemagglutinin N-terminal domain-containing protein [Pseudomonas sp. SK3(2021)]|uniref:two-partner secretion domain-containing protein n=1 Tax=Pseudomonas sp. SK3(2021) TaxID=2841064 RepID=UPI00192BE4AE|nr:filamentous hemagglutinin N-terminal domain-containing protein [Pseudomonas sp. SK3(2021)]QQZ42325.1 filamentous hemagglutinin N-terminal domain-containing protein [Pseudomonas sp. SK3(2021)]